MQGFDLRQVMQVSYSGHNLDQGEEDMQVQRTRNVAADLRSLLVLILLAMGAGACSSGTATETGRALYENQCQSCHRSVSVFADMEPARLQAELAAPALRKHRFRLSLEQQQALLDYLQDGR